MGKKIHNPVRSIQNVRSGSLTDSFRLLSECPLYLHVQRNLDFVKDVRWPGLSRPRRAPFRAGEVLDVGILDRAFYRTGTRIELPEPNFWGGSVGFDFPLSGFLRRFRLCP